MINEDSWDIYSELVTDDHNQKNESVNELNKLLTEAKSTIQSLKTDLKNKEERETTLTQQNEELKKNISALLLTAKSELRRKNLIINDLRDQLEEYQKRSFFNGGYNGGIQRHYSKGEPVTTGRVSSHRTEEQQTRNAKRKNTEDLEQNAPKRSRTSEQVPETTTEVVSKDRDGRSNSKHDTVSDNNDLRTKIKLRLGETKSEKEDKKSEKSERNDINESNTGSNKGLDLREKLRNRRASQVKTKEILPQKKDSTNENKTKEKTVRVTACVHSEDKKPEQKTNTNMNINTENSCTNKEELPLKSDSTVKNNIMSLNGTSSKKNDDVMSANSKTATQSMQIYPKSINECISEIRKQEDKNLDKNSVIEKCSVVEKNVDINSVSNRLRSHLAKPAPVFSKNGECSIEKGNVASTQKNSNSVNKMDESQEESKVRLRDPRRKGTVEQCSKIVSEKCKSTLPTPNENVIPRDPRKRAKHVKTDSPEETKTTDENPKENSTVDIFSVEDKECLLLDSSCLKITTEDGDIEHIINKRDNQATDPRKKPQEKLVVDLLPVYYVGNVETPDIVWNENPSVVFNEAVGLQSSVLNKCDKTIPKVNVSSMIEGVPSSSFHKIRKDEDRNETSADSDRSSRKLLTDVGSTQQSSSTDTCSQSLRDSQGSDKTNSLLTNNKVSLKQSDSLVTFEENANYLLPKMPTPLVNKAIVSAISASDIMAALNPNEGLDGNVCVTRSEATMDTDIFESVKSCPDTESLTKIKNTRDSDSISICETEVSTSKNKLSSQTVKTKKSFISSDTPVDLSIHRDSDKKVLKDNACAQNLHHVSVTETKRCGSSDKLSNIEKHVDSENVKQDISQSNDTKLSNKLHSNGSKLENSVHSHPTLSSQCEGIKIISAKTSSPIEVDVNLSSKPKEVSHGTKKSSTRKESSVDKKLLTKSKSKQNLKSSDSATKVGKVGDKVEVQDDTCKSTRSRSSSKLIKPHSSKQSSAPTGSSIMRNKEGKSHSPKDHKQDSSKSDRQFTKIESKSKEKHIKNIVENSCAVEEISKEDNNSQYHGKSQEFVSAGESDFETILKSQETNCEKQKHEKVLSPVASHIDNIVPEEISKKSIAQKSILKNTEKVESSLTDDAEAMDVSFEECGHDTLENKITDKTVKETFNEGRNSDNTEKNEEDKLDSESRNDSATTNSNREHEKKPESFLAENEKESGESLINQTPVNDTPLSGGWLARLFSSGNESEFVKRLQKIEEDIEVLKTATLQRNVLLATSSDKTPCEKVIDLDIKTKCSDKKQTSIERPVKRRGRKPKTVPLARKRLECDSVTSSSDVLVGSSGSHLNDESQPRMDSDESMTRRTRSSERLRAKQEHTLVPETIKKVKPADRVSHSTANQPPDQAEVVGNASSSIEDTSGLNTNSKIVLEPVKNRVISEQDSSDNSESQSYTMEVVEENDMVVDSSLSRSTHQISSKLSNLTVDTSLGASTVSPSASLSHDLVLSNTSMESFQSVVNSEDSNVSIHSADSSSSFHSKNQSVQKSFTVNETFIECEPNHSDESESSDDNDSEDERETKVDSPYNKAAVQMLKSDLDLSSDSNGSENSVLETDSQKTIPILHKTPTKNDGTSRLSSTPPSSNVKCSMDIDNVKFAPLIDPAPLSPPVSPEASAWSRISPVPKFVQSKTVNCDSKLLALVNLSAHYLQSSGHSLNFDSRRSESKVDIKEPEDENGTLVPKTHENILVRSSTPRRKPVKKSTAINEAKKVEISESDDHVDECASSVIEALETSMSNSNKCVNAESAHCKEDISESGLLSSVSQAHLTKSGDILESTTSKPFKKPSIEDFKIFQAGSVNDVTDDTDESKEDGEITQDSIDDRDVPEMLADSNSVNFVFDAKIDEDDELLKDPETEISVPKKTTVTPKKAFVIPKKTRSSPRLCDKSRSSHNRTECRTSTSKGHAKHEDRKISWRERSKSPPSKGRRRLYEPHDKAHGHSSSRRGDCRSNRPETSSRDRSRGRDHSRESNRDRSRHRRDRS